MSATSGVGVGQGIGSGSLFGIITFYKLLTAPDGSGGTTGSYVKVLTTRAAINPLTGRRALEEGQAVDIQGVEFTMRWRKDIPLNTRMLIQYRGQQYTIYSIVDTLNRRMEFVILGRAREGLTNIVLP